jgi:hypothetical protein
VQLSEIFFTNVTEVRRFLGLSNYFRKFIQNYSILATPLTALSGAKAPWKWGQEQQEAFTKIKEALVRAPILTLPDVRRPFKVVCDACDYGVGAVLFQDGKVCAYFSKMLGASERNYSATERELLAVVYALTEWRCYLLGKPVTVVTDHKCNTFLGQQVGLSPRRARWAERLQEFEIEWVWEPGKTNIADPDPYVDDTPIVTKPTSGTGMTFTQQINDMLEGKPQALKELLLANEDLFAKQLPGLPPEREVFHTINLEEGHRPPNRPAYRLAPSELAECEKTVDELLKLGLIRPSCSPFASPVLFVRKKDGSLRMVIDYRPLNKITISDRYPLPRIDDLLDRLKGAKVFSSLDLLSGYHQVRLRKEDVPKTAFRTPFGLYEFLVLPFGLTNAPATFQRLMNEVFHDYIREGFVVVYLDDVLIYSKTEEEHLGQLERVFTRLREHQLLAKLVKCSFFEKQLRYLGHIIGENGLEVDMDKVKVVLFFVVLLRSAFCAGTHRNKGGSM